MRLQLLRNVFMYLCYVVCIYRSPTSAPTTLTPTDPPTDAPTQSICIYSVQQYVDICYCGNEEEEAAGLQYFNDNVNNDIDGYIKLSLPVQVFYVLVLLVISNAVLVFGRCIVVIRNLYGKCNDDDSVKFTKQVNFSDAEDE